MSTVWGNVEYVDTSKTIGKKMRDYTSESTTMMIKEASTSSERSEESDQEANWIQVANIRSEKSGRDFHCKQSENRAQVCCILPKLH